MSKKREMRKVNIAAVMVASIMALGTWFATPYGVSPVAAADELQTTSESGTMLIPAQEGFYDSNRYEIKKWKRAGYL